MKNFAAACIALFGMAAGGCGQINMAPATAESQTSAERRATAEEWKKIIGKPSMIAAGPKNITVELGGGVKLKMTFVPAGEFMMGSSESAEATADFFNKTYGPHAHPSGLLTKDSFTDEHPQHRVRITQPFYLGTYHVTRGQFRQFVAETRYKTSAETEEPRGGSGYNLDTMKYEFTVKYSWLNVGFEQSDEHPVVNVSWNDAVAFCEWLSKKESKTYRLPTEAEWEYACRAGTTTRYYSGDDPETLAQVGNVADAALRAKIPVGRGKIKANDGYVFTAPVGRFKPNAFGLYDMHGNAWQWCADWRVNDYYAKSPVDDPTGPDSEPTQVFNDGTVLRGGRVLRGGSWHNGHYKSRSAARWGSIPFTRDCYVGFRVARSE
jgi:formylglycine-generating enzyme